MTRPFFSKERITHFDIFDRHAEHALNKASARLKEGVPVDWQDLVSRFTMDSATEFLFGKDVCSLDAPLPYPSSYAPSEFQSDEGANRSRTVHPADRFVNAFQKALEATAIRGRYLQSWPIMEFWKDRVKEHLAAVDEFIDPIVDEALQRKAAAGFDAEKEQAREIRDDETLLEHLVKYTDGTLARVSLPSSY